MPTVARSRATMAPSVQADPPAETPIASAMEALDEAIHQKARLGVMSTLIAMGEADFKLLKETLGLSDGNLSTHLTLLEARGYITIKKQFRGRKPHTSAALTEAGRIAFGEYVEALGRIIKSSGEKGNW